MDLLTIFFVSVIIVLGYFLVKKNVKPENTATVENKSNKSDLSKRVIIEELEDQFFALDKYNKIINSTVSHIYYNFSPSNPTLNLFDQ